MDKYKGEVGLVHKSSYAWVSKAGSFSVKPETDAKILCAWCNKSESEIKKTEDPNTHIENHVKEEK